MALPAAQHSLGQFVSQHARVRLLLAGRARAGFPDRMKARTLAALCCWVAISSFSVSAAPCGVFVALPTKAVPSLAVEQTLILHDAEQELEHFVRQVAIRDPSPGFGFVVPVPEQPVVAKVAESPFEKLAERFPVHANLSVPGALGGLGSGAGAPTGAPVQVLSRSKVGSFTAFVLSASDPKALQKWFSDNRLVVPAEAHAWLTHYVKLGFFFAALRYEIDEKDLTTKTTRAETIRITFKSTLPFYPYRESERPHPSDQPRDLAIWLVATQPYTPVSLFESHGTGRWKRPLAEHLSSSLLRSSFDGVLSQELMSLLPKGWGEDGRPLSLQVFEDQKRNRTGFGDIVMVPKQQAAPGALNLARSRKLMASLDPAVKP